MKLILLTIVLSSVLIQDALSYGLAGGMTEARPATAEVRELAYKMQRAVEMQLNRRFDMFKAVTYATQIVAGTNYFIKVQVSNYEYVHVRVFVPLPYTGMEPELSRVVDKKMETDPLAYF